MGRAIPRILVLTAAIAAVGLGSLLDPAKAQSPQVEYQVKAAFLYNFLKFVTWPQDATSSESAPVVIGILGPDPFGPALEQALEGKTDRGRPIVVRRWKDLEAMRRSGEACQLLYIARPMSEQVETINAASARLPVLTVGDVPGFCQRGGMINMASNGESIRLEANVGAAAAAGLVVSSKLLGLAKLYSTGDPQ